MSSLTRALTVAGVIAVGIAACSARAEAQVFEPLKFHTSFPFTVARMTFPAGTYTIRPIEMDPYVLEISDGRSSKFLEVESAGAPVNMKAEDGVLFNKVGDQYVLSEIWDAAEHAGVEPVPAANQPKLTAAHQRHHHIA